MTAQARLYQALQTSFCTLLGLLTSRTAAILLAIAFIALIAHSVVKGVNRFKASKDGGMSPARRRHALRAAARGTAFGYIGCYPRSRAAMP